MFRHSHTRQPLDLTRNDKRATGRWPDRMRRSASRAIIVDGGRVTATARADIGASKTRRKAWVPGWVQMCDDDGLRAAISIGSLLCLRAPGHLAGMEVPMAKQSNRRCDDQLTVLHPAAAGIEVGASELFVDVSSDRDPQPVRRLPTFTRGTGGDIECCGPFRAGRPRFKTQPRLLRRLRDPVPRNLR
jgi:hypothetical protein